MKNIRIEDAKISREPMAVTPAVLAPGEVGVATATYTVNQADKDAGKVENTALALGEDSKGNKVTDTSDSGNEVDGDGDDDPTVTPVVDGAPVAKDDNYTTPMNTPIKGESVADNDTPSSDGQNLWTVTTPPSNGALTLNEDGSFVYTAEEDYTGVDSFVYQVCDADGDCASATVTLKISETVKDNKTVAVDDKYDLSQASSSLSEDVSKNDYDPEGDAQIKFEITTQPQHGTIDFHENGTFTYTPDKTFDGEDVFTYKVYDSGTPQATDEAKVTITGEVVKEPVARDDESTTEMNTPVDGNVLPNDESPENLSLFVEESPVEKPQHGTVVINSDGSYTYTPNENFKGEDSFTYQVCDENDNCTTAVVKIAVVCPKFKDSVNIPEVISPNGDGINDTWEIVELKLRSVCNANNKVMIFNRWGAKVYEKVHYMSDDERFDGFSTNSLDFQNEKHLPAGTYFYIIEVDGLVETTGYLYIITEGEDS